MKIDLDSRLYVLLLPGVWVIRFQLLMPKLAYSQNREFFLTKAKSLLVKSEKIVKT